MENVKSLDLLVEFGICVGTKLYGKIHSEYNHTSFLTISHGSTLTKL